MKLRQLVVENFRGIKSLDWRPNGSFICLVGPGDSCKSTILDAIDLVLSPRWAVAFDDSDFHQCETQNPIVIDATVGDLSKDIIHEARFGLRLRGMNAANEFHDEPEEDDDRVITVRLTVTKDLEPEWSVVTDRDPDGIPIHAKDRERLGALRLGAYVDRHMTWSRGSILARLTGDLDQHSGLLATASRKARDSFNSIDLTDLNAAARRAQELAADFGVKTPDDFCAHLDASALSLGANGLSLHAAKIPVRSLGLGSRRLVAMALQSEVGTSGRGGITLVDEVEQGLEPHRIRQVLAKLRVGSNAVLVTTHSPTVIHEFAHTGASVVRNSQGRVEVQPIPPSLKDIVKRNPFALLARRIVVCEGVTEIGFLQGMEAALTEQPFAYHGIVLADGGGNSTGATANAFIALGYETAVFADSDCSIGEALGVLGASFRWADKASIEERLLADLPTSAIDTLVQIAGERLSARTVRDQLAEFLGVQANTLSEDPSSWWDGRDETTLREVLAKAAKKRSWFKRLELGREVGKVVASHLHSVSTTDTAQVLERLRVWMGRP